MKEQIESMQEAELKALNKQDVELKVHRESTQATELKDKHESIQEAELKVLNKQDVKMEVHAEPT